MARRDSEKDSERPHYYSQFWLDVAAGRRVIGAPKEEEEEDEDRTEDEDSEPAFSRGMGRISDLDEDDIVPAATNGHRETIEHPIVEPLEEPEIIAEPEIGEEEEDLDLEDEEIPDVDLGPVDEEEEEELYDEDEEEEEEDDWGGRGRKKSKPSRPTKPSPRGSKGGKRDTRRGF